MGMAVYKVRKMLADILGMEAEDIPGHMALTKDNGVDPLGLAKWIIACEKEFRITINDEAVLAFHCVNDTAAYIDNMLSLGLNEMPERTEEDRVAWFYE